MQNVSNHVSVQSIPSHWQTQKFHMSAFIFVFFPVSISYCTTPCYNVIRDLFVLLTFAKAEVIWFDTLVSDQSFAFLHVFAY